LSDNLDDSSAASRGPSDAERPQDDDTAKFKTNLVRVMAVQVVTLLLLGYLQYLFTP
jgi:hypothetical protein